MGCEAEDVVLKGGELGVVVFGVFGVGRDVVGFEGGGHGNEEGGGGRL